MHHLGTKKLQTKRLILRRFKMSDDVEMFDNWANDNEVTKYLTWPAHQNVSATRTILKDWIAQYDNSQFYQWGIELKDSNQLIGSVGSVSLNNQTKSVHIGYCIGQKWWHQGIMSEALECLIEFFFNEVKVNRVESRHDPKNIGSGKVMQNCGMLYEGTIKQGDWNNQGICDYSIYGLTLEDYVD